jgi:hypothetical protein
MAKQTRMTAKTTTAHTMTLTLLKMKSSIFADEDDAGSASDWHRNRDQLNNTM